MKKKAKQIEEKAMDLLSEEVVFIILDLVAQNNPSDLKSFSLTCKWFYQMESKHRTSLRPLRPEYLPRILKRYPNTSDLDLTFCPRVTDYALSVVGCLSGPTLRSVDLSRSFSFTAAGLLRLAVKCVSLVEIDLSNATEMRDAGAAAVAEAKSLERLKMERCKKVTDMGIGCIAVGCRKLKNVSLKWCVGVGDLGVALLSLKCKDIRSLDLSYLPVSFFSSPLVDLIISFSFFNLLREYVLVVSFLTYRSQASACMMFSNFNTLNNFLYKAVSVSMMTLLIHSPITATP